MDDATLYRELRSINTKISDLQEEVRVGFATLPSQYVTQASINEAHQESKIAKRFAIGATITSLAALGTYINFII